MRRLLIVLFIIGFNNLHAQDAQVILRDVYNKFHAVKNYRADAVIKTDIRFLKILPQKARIFYREPDQFKVKSQGIAIVPKQNFEELFVLLGKPDAYIGVLSGKDNINAVPVSIINIIPVADTTDLILARVWIDTTRNLILRSQLTTRSSGTVLLDYTYGQQIKFALPDQVVFTVELKKFKIPRAVAADINSSAKVQPDAKTGTIKIILSNYIINK